MNQTKRPVCEGAEEILNLYFPVLDHGFISLIDYEGGETTIERAARVSTATSPLNPEDSERLIRQLAAEGHNNPGEHFKFTFHVRAPIFVARQWFRTRCANYNELSGRYRSLDPVFYYPDEIRFQTKGKSPVALTDINGRDSLVDAYGCAEISYCDLLADDWERGLARIPLPQSTYTEWWWGIDYSNLTQFIGKRDDSHAQKEIRDYAHILGGIVAKCLPVNWQAYLDYSFNARKFSAMELEVLRNFMRHLQSDPMLGSIMNKINAQPVTDFSLPFDRAFVASEIESIVKRKAK